MAWPRQRDLVLTCFFKHPVQAALSVCQEACRLESQPTIILLPVPAGKDREAEEGGRPIFSHSLPQAPAFDMFAGQVCATPCLAPCPAHSELCDNVCVIMFMTEGLGGVWIWSWPECWPCARSARATCRGRTNAL